MSGPVPDGQRCRADGCTAHRAAVGLCPVHLAGRLCWATANPSYPDATAARSAVGKLSGDALAAVRRALIDRAESGATPAIRAQAVVALAWLPGTKNDMAVEGGNRPPGANPAENRPDPLLPVVRSVREAPEREAGRLAFGGVLDPNRDLPAQLPLLPAPDGPRVPLLELADVRGGPVMARGRGAPLDLRLFVGACLWTPHHARSARVRLAVTVRELRDWLWPHGWRRATDWRKLREALWRARDFTIPDGRGLWLPFALRRDPGPDAALDDVALIDVELPPGAGDGPVIDRRALALLGVESAPRFRAYIAAHSVAWLPGRTRFPHPKNRRVILWAGDPDKYPILTRGDRRRLAFGPDAKNRTRMEQDAAWEDLPGVEIVGRMVDGPDGRRGWLIVPEAAAAAIKRRGD